MSDAAELATLGSLRSEPVAETNAVEAAAAIDTPPGLPPLPDLHFAAQRGDVAEMRAQLQKGDPNLRADDGTTALHWAAFNNRMSACTALLDAGADPNATGGFMGASPLMWAARNGHVYVVRLLLENGAKYAVKDEQGFTPLHLAVNSSNVLLVVYLTVMQAAAGVDFVDSQDRRTPLHQAAYQGDYMSVEALLRAGANVHARDSAGMTPLHWAVVSGSLPAVRTLLNHGSDPFAFTDENRSVFDVAAETNNAKTLQNGLILAGRTPEGALRPKSLSPRATKLVTFLTPWLLVPACLLAIKYVPFYLGVLVAGGFVYVAKQVLQKFVLYNLWPGRSATMESPLLAGVFTGFLFWVVALYMRSIFPTELYVHPVIAVLFLVSVAASIYCYIGALKMDPGIVRAGNDSDIRSAINALLDSGEYDSKHFCYATYARIPARAHYDKVVGQVVARFDHYCPWLYNSVGLRNQRLFVMFLMLLSLAVVLLAFQIGDFLANSPHPLWATLTAMQSTTLFIALTIPIMVWILLLTVIQLAQIARAVTTFETMKKVDPGDKAATFSSLPDDHPRANHKPREPAPAHTHVHHHSHGFRRIAALLGVKNILGTSKLLLGKDKNTNPANHGIRRNCSDFWWAGGSMFEPDAGYGAINGEEVDYYRLWQPARSPTRAESALRRLQ